MKIKFVQFILSRTDTVDAQTRIISIIVSLRKLIIIRRHECLGLIEYLIPCQRRGHNPKVVDIIFSYSTVTIHALLRRIPEYRIQGLLLFIIFQDQEHVNIKRLLQYLILLLFDLVFRE